MNDDYENFMFEMHETSKDVTIYENDLIETKQETDMKLNYQDLPYPSTRNVLVAKNGMVATGSSLASAAGLEILRKGGNAVDAAIATAAALTVVEPTANGIGGDAFALVWMKDKLHGLNGSGPSPKNISIKAVKDKHGDVNKMPTFGWTPVTVPGVPKAWAALSKRFGKLSLIECLEPAIRYAEEGYPVGPVLAQMWQSAYQRYQEVGAHDPSFKAWFETYTFDGKSPAFGEIVKLPEHAKTLRLIGETNSDAFYHGSLADRIVETSNQFGGFFTKEDLSSYVVSWVDPISVNYRGYDVCEIPPNGQGITALMALNVLRNFDFEVKEDVGAYHKQFEAMKMAFMDAKAFVSDPRTMQVNYQDLLSQQFGIDRANEIGDIAKRYEPKQPPKSGTVYLCTADGEGNMVSYIQSNYMGFGSGMVVDGISLQNRGCDFSLDAKHVNALEGAKKTYHTIIPGFLMKDGKAVGPFGVMGGYMQPQGHVQVVMNMIDFELNPQSALDAPRWQWIEGLKFIVESNFNVDIIQQLVDRGHQVEVSKNTSAFGRGQIIIRLDNGTLVGACEGRTDSNIACY